MLRHLLQLSAAAAILAAPADAEVTVTVQGPLLELSISESIEARPDLAEVSAGVSTDVDTAIAAMQDKAGTMSATVDWIKALGIAERDIQTTGINLNPRYDYDEQSRRQIFRG